jgi:hypothetical protein
LFLIFFGKQLFTIFLNSNWTQNIFGASSQQVATLMLMKKNLVKNEEKKLFSRVKYDNLTVFYWGISPVSSVTILIKKNLVPPHVISNLFIISTNIFIIGKNFIFFKKKPEMGTR